MSQITFVLPDCKLVLQGISALLINVTDDIMKRKPCYKHVQWCFEAIKSLQGNKSLFTDDKPFKFKYFLIMICQCSIAFVFK